MLIKFNGTLVEAQATTTITNLLKTHSLSTDGIIVVLNDAILTKEDWSQKTLNDGDSIEILKFLGGG